MVNLFIGNLIGWNKMTGEKNRYTTQEKLWKLEDGELSTPKHDELVFQLIKKENAMKLLKLMNINNDWRITAALNFFDFLYSSTDGRIRHFCDLGDNEARRVTELNDEIVGQFKQQYKYWVENNSLQQIDNIKNKFIPEIKCEFPIKSGSNHFIMGYIDVQYRIIGMIGDCRQFVYEIDNFKDRWNEDIPGFKVYSNTAIRFTNESCYDRISTINIEVKPTIKSFGETLRQVNTYASACPGAVHVIYSPDDRFKEAFESQGIRFITPKDLGLN